LRSPSVTRTSQLDEQDESGSTSATSRSYSLFRPNSTSAIADALSGRRSRLRNEEHPRPRPDNSHLLEALIKQLEEDINKLPAQPAPFTELTRRSSQPNNLTAKQKNILENAKNMVMQIALFQLDPYEYVDPTVEPAHAWQILIVVLSLSLGVLYSGAESFTGSFDLFSRLLAMSEPVSFTIGIVFAVFSNLLFFALEARGFVVEVGIASPANLYTPLQITKNKLESTKAFSSRLRPHPDAPHITADLETYKKNFALLNMFQEDINRDYQHILPPNNFLHNYVLPTLKILFSFSGSLLFALGGIIIAKDLVANIAALSFGVALSVPVTNIIIATLALAGFVLYFALQNTGVFTLFDALIGRPKELIHELQEYGDEIITLNNNIILKIDELTTSAQQNQNSHPRHSVDVTSSTVSRPLTNGFHSNSPLRLLPPAMQPLPLLPQPAQANTNRHRHSF
jgi:hypothetical protein